MNNFIKPLKWATFAIMPLVYDESLSYVEVLNKVVAKLNEVITSTNNFTKNVNTIVTNWLKTDEGSAALENSVGEFIEAYSKTQNFKDILIQTLSEQSDEITLAATTATQQYLKSTDGVEMLNENVQSYLNTYVKSQEFATLINSFVAELDNIKRGEKLDIRQTVSAKIYSPNTLIQGTDVTGDYTVNESGAAVEIKPESATIWGQNKTGGFVRVTAAEIVMNNDVNMSFDGATHKIVNLANPTSALDAANKQYVDGKLSDGGGDYVVNLTYSTTDGKWHSNETFAQIVAKLPAVLVKTSDNVFYTVSGYTGSVIRFVKPYAVTTGTVKTVTVDVMEFTSDNVWNYYTTSINTTEFIRADGTTIFSANQSMGGNRLTTVGTPVNDTDAVNKNYVDRTVGTVIYATGEIAQDGAGIDSITGVDYNAVEAAILKNDNVKIVVQDMNTDNITVFQYVYKHVLSVSGTNRFRYVFVSAWDRSTTSGTATMPSGFKLLELSFEEADVTGQGREKSANLVIDTSRLPFDIKSWNFNPSSPAETTISTWTNLDMTQAALVENMTSNSNPRWFISYNQTWYVGTVVVYDENAIVFFFPYAGWASSPKNGSYIKVPKTGDIVIL